MVILLGEFKLTGMDVEIIRQWKINGIKLKIREIIEVLHY